METFPIIFGCLLAVATLGSCQQGSLIMGDPGMEPWGQLVTGVCMLKGRGPAVTNAHTTAAQCMARLSPPQNPVGICSKLKERNNCLKPYYEEVKTCFHKTNGADDLDQAFKAQAEAAEFFCKDNAKEFMKLASPDNQCQPKDYQACLSKKIKGSRPDTNELFSEENCKKINALVDCQEESFKDCKTMVMKDFMIGQVRSVLEETPCAPPKSEPEQNDDDDDEPNSAVTAAPILLLTVVCNALVKAVF